MPVTNYYSAGGDLYGESTGGVSTTYMSDALGSTIGTITSAGVRNRYVYSPYGQLLSKTGTDPDPKYMWNGRTQSRVTGCPYAEQYNRRRHVSTTTAQWASRDMLWPLLRPYGYSFGNPTTYFDRTGRIPSSSSSGSPYLNAGCSWTPFGGSLDQIECSPACNNTVAKYCSACYSFNGEAAPPPGFPECVGVCDGIASMYYAACGPKHGKPRRPFPRGPGHWVPGGDPRTPIISRRPPSPPPPLSGGPVLVGPCKTVSNQDPGYNCYQKGVWGVVGMGPDSNFDVNGCKGCCTTIGQANQQLNGWSKTNTEWVYNCWDNCEAWEAGWNLNHERPESIEFVPPSPSGPYVNGYATGGLEEGREYSVWEILVIFFEEISEGLEFGL